MMPVFQSDLTPLAWPRDLLGGPVGPLPWLRTQMVTQLGGAQVGRGSVGRCRPRACWTIAACDYAVSDMMSR